MQQPYSIKPSDVLAVLATKAKLTNIISSDALIEAREIWSDYIATSNSRRDADDVSTVANKLRLIITQVAHRRCRINPTMWHKLVHLEQEMRESVMHRIMLEPNTNNEEAA